MQHYIGLNQRELDKHRINVPIIYDPTILINAHILISGMSGMGKSTQAGNFLSSAAHAGIELDIFDPHDELENVPGATACIFSQATGYGYNPLVLDTNPHTGGVNSQVDFFVRLIKNVTPQFGIKQESALRSLLADTYAAYNITQEDPRSWHKQSINETTRLALLEAGELDQLHQCYPTLEDLMALALEKVIGLTIGIDNKCVTALEQHSRLLKRHDIILNKKIRSVSDEEIRKLEGQIKNQKKACCEAYDTYIYARDTGREIDDIIKYDSVTVLTSVLQRIKLLGATGILSANEPPFRNSKVRVHQIKALSHDQQVLYVKLRLQNIFDCCKRKGQVPPGSIPRHIVYLDEAHKYFTPEPDDIINIIAKESRKFGLGLWCASQEPTSFPESFLTNVGTTILLGIHTSYWKRAASMFRISEDMLKGIKPKEIMAVKMLRDGCVDPPFMNVVVPNPNSEMGRRAAAVTTQIGEVISDATSI